MCTYRVYQGLVIGAIWGKFLIRDLRTPRSRILHDFSNVPHCIGLDLFLWCCGSTIRYDIVRYIVLTPRSVEVGMLSTPRSRYISI